MRVNLRVSRGQKFQSGSNQTKSELKLSDGSVALCAPTFTGEIHDTDLLIEYQ